MAQRRRCSDVPSRAFGAFYATRFDSDPFRRDGRRGRLPRASQLNEFGSGKSVTQTEDAKVSYLQAACMFFAVSFDLACGRWEAPRAASPPCHAGGFNNRGVTAVRLKRTTPSPHGLAFPYS